MADFHFLRQNANVMSVTCLLYLFTVTVPNSGGYSRICWERDRKTKERPIINWTRPIVCPRNIAAVKSVHYCIPARTRHAHHLIYCSFKMKTTARNILWYFSQSDSSMGIIRNCFKDKYWIFALLIQNLSVNLHSTLSCKSDLNFKREQCPTYQIPKQWCKMTVNRAVKILARNKMRVDICWL